MHETKKLVSRKINNSTVMSVSVGLKALSDISPLIAGGLKERYKKNQYDVIDIIIADAVFIKITSLRLQKKDNGKRETNL
ncbi:MAG: hypothetical protein PHW82_13420 [Bacteroidales bacterium]|nr:hypothetical protein [Bacteroidales bacterium]